MGGSNSKRDESFDPNQWQEIDDPNNDQDGQYTVVRNRRTGQLLDRYQLQFQNQKQYNRYLDSVEYRRDEENIVRVVHYEPKVVKQFCGSSYMLNVYLEHCRSRFCQFKDIPSPDNLYCAVAMLDGYQKLYRKVGRFYVSQNQAMIDENGKIRVWLNSDFSQNQAQDLRPINNNNLINKSQQYTMVNDIMNIIFQNSDDTDQPQHSKFRDYYERQKVTYDQRIGFGQARNIIYDYAKNNNIQIPDVFTSVLNIYQHGQDGLEGGLDDEHPVGGRRMLDGEQFHMNQSQNHGRYNQVNSVINPLQNNSNNMHNTNTNIHNTNINNNTNTYNSGRVYSSISQAHPTFAPMGNSNFNNTINSNSNRNIITNNNNQLPTSARNNLTTSPLPIYQQQQSQFRNIPVAVSQPPRLVTGAQPMAVNRGFNYQNNMVVNQGPRAGGPGFSFTIKPQPGVMNRNAPINISQSPRPIPQQGGAPPLAFGPGPSYTPSLSNLNPATNPNPAQLPSQTQNITNQILTSGPVKKAGSLPQQLQPFSQQNNQQTVARQQNKLQLGQQQLQIQKKFILRNHGNNEQYINQANVIRDLSELHKIQQQQRSKRSNIQVDNSRNVSQNKQQSHENQHQHQNQNQHEHENEQSHEYKNNQQSHEQQQQYYKNHNYSNDDKLSQDILKEAQKDLDEVKRKNKNNNNNYQGGYEGFYQQQNLFRQNTGEISNTHAEDKQFGYQQNNVNINTANNNFRSQPLQSGQQQKIMFNNSSNSTALYQQNTNTNTNNNYYTVNQQQNLNRPPLPPQLQTYQTYNSTNTYNRSVGITQGQNMALGESPSKRQFYFTIANQIELDPQIANDLALYVKT